MPIGTVTMILANVGLQMYNNWCGNRQNRELQQKREEFEQAARERNKERMWKLMREGQELTRQLEEEKHRQRLDELKNDIGNLLQRMAYTATINNWPLNVLPVVMKNQALGNLLANQEGSIAMHCIFTPSNSHEFNKHVFPLVERSLETYCNQHWSITGDHPVLFYSGAWQTATAPTEIQIDSMRTALGNLPTLLITPFFRPSDGRLIFQLRMWGVGASGSDNAEFNGLNEFEPTEFQRTYTDKDDYVNETGLWDEITEDVVPYLECLIGYMADTYFWAALGLAPCLPRLLMSGVINTDGMKYLVDGGRKYYETLLNTSEQKDKEQIFEATRSLELYEGASCFWSDELRNEKLEALFISYCSKHAGEEFHSMKECLNFENFTKEDLPFIREFRGLYKGDSFQKELAEIQSVLEAVDFDYSILESTDIACLERLVGEGNTVAMFRLGEIYEYSIGIERYDINQANKFYNDALNNGFILAKIYMLIHAGNTNEIRPLTNQELFILNYLHRKNVALSSIFLSQYYFYGADKNRKKVLSYLEEAPETTNPELYYWVAKVLWDFYGQDGVKSVEYNLEKAAKQGYIEAQLLLMNNYQEGGIFKECPQKVFEYAKMAAKQGAIEGIGKVGRCLIMGYGTFKDRSKGIDFIKYAAQKGDKVSIELLKRL